MGMPGLQRTGLQNTGLQKTGWIGGLHPRTGEGEQVEGRATEDGVTGDGVD